MHEACPVHVAKQTTLEPMQGKTFVQCRSRKLLLAAKVRARLPTQLDAMQHETLEPIGQSVTRLLHQPNTTSHPAQQIFLSGLYNLLAMYHPLRTGAAGMMITPQLAEGHKRTVLRQTI